MDLLVASVQPLNLMGQMGYRYLEPGTLQNPTDYWVFAVYPTPNEAFGGYHDGGLVYPGFSLDLGHFLEGFGATEDLVWHAPAVYNGELDGPEVSLKGSFTGRRVWVRVFAQPPSDVMPSLVVDLANGNCWEKSG